MAEVVITRLSCMSDVCLRIFLTKANSILFYFFIYLTVRKYYNPPSHTFRKMAWPWYWLFALWTWLCAENMKRQTANCIPAQPLMTELISKEKKNSYYNVTAEVLADVFVLQRTCPWTCTHTHTQKNTDLWHQCCVSLSPSFSDKVIRHRACSLKDTAHAIFASELDPEFDRMCEEIKEARRKRGKKIKAWWKRRFHQDTLAVVPKSKFPSLLCRLEAML